MSSFLGQRLGAMAAIFCISLFAVSFPSLSQTSKHISIPKILFFIGKHFGTGVILSTAFCHLLQDAFENLTSELVKREYPGVGEQTGFIILGSLIAIFLVEYISTCYVDYLHEQHSPNSSPASSTLASPEPSEGEGSDTETIQPNEVTPLLTSSPQSQSYLSTATPSVLSETDTPPVPPLHPRSFSTYTTSPASAPNPSSSSTSYSLGSGSPTPTGAGAPASAPALPSRRHSYHPNSYTHDHTHPHPAHVHDHTHPTRPSPPTHYLSSIVTNNPRHSISSHGSHPHPRRDKEQERLHSSSHSHHSHSSRSHSQSHSQSVTYTCSPSASLRSMSASTSTCEGEGEGEGEDGRTSTPLRKSSARSLIGLRGRARGCRCTVCFGKGGCGCGYVCSSPERVEEDVGGDHSHSHSQSQNHPTRHNQHHQRVQNQRAKAKERQKHLLSILVLQFGIMLHSFVIGVTLAITRGVGEFASLVTAIVFHQLFEGLSLGIRIAGLPPPAATTEEGGWGKGEGESDTLLPTHVHVRTFTSSPERGRGWFSWLKKEKGSRKGRGSGANGGKYKSQPHSQSHSRGSPSSSSSDNHGRLRHRSRRSDPHPARPRPRSLLQPLLTFTFAITTPAGMGLGMILFSSGGSETQTQESHLLLTQGLMCAVSAGMLIYAATVEMLAGDFVFGSLSGHGYGGGGHSHDLSGLGGRGGGGGGHGHGHEGGVDEEDGEGEGEGDERTPTKRAIAVCSLLAGVVAMGLIGVFGEG
ncbi:hypothetical protein D9758_014875 [Tetrapyrgos nigripes]|uniref:Zinc/iron permease n=1 Tax=Tetrapyrgos nigripes TaxID=182062 RepID=A0A8H5CDA8_9AGAR|nr:hypothetical protein D9758_014875 [Tetrapyrgos nigripes]